MIKLHTLLGTLVFVLGVFTSAACNAHGGGYGGWHGGGWHGNAWRGGGWYGGAPLGFFGGGLGFWGPSVVIGGFVPACRTVHVCNTRGYCWLEDDCY